MKGSFRRFVFVYRDGETDEKKTKFKSSLSATAAGARPRILNSKCRVMIVKWRVEALVIDQGTYAKQMRRSEATLKIPTSSVYVAISSFSRLARLLFVKKYRVLKPNEICSNSELEVIYLLLKIYYLCS